MDKLAILKQRLRAAQEKQLLTHREWTPSANRGQRGAVTRAMSRLAAEWYGAHPGDIQGLVDYITEK